MDNKDPCSLKHLCQTAANSSYFNRKQLLLHCWAVMFSVQHSALVVVSLLALCWGYSAHLKKYFTVLSFTLKLDAVSCVRVSEHLNQNLVTVGFHKILTWLTSRKHGFTYCGKRNGEPAYLFMFSVFRLMGCVYLTDADMEDVLPHLLLLVTSGVSS